MFTGFNELKNIVHKYNFDSFLVTETWLSPIIPSEQVSINGYKIIREDRVGRRGGGIALFHREDINVYKLNIENTNSASLEQLWVSFKINNVTFALGGIYRPPSTNGSDCISELENSISYLTTVVDEIVLTGDININLLNTVNKNSIKFTEFLETYGLSLVNHEPTRVNAYNDSLIDIISISNHELNLTCKTSRNL